MNYAGFKKRLFARTSAIIFLLALSYASTVFGWHDETHLAVAKAAGYYKWYNAACADITKIKAGPIEGNNHYFNNIQHVKITPGLVLEQVKRYNDPKDTGGHLYGAIIASLSAYVEATEKGKYAEYHLAFCAHYIGDLSQPFHNIPYDNFNKIHHTVNDGIVEDEVLEKIEKIKAYMYPIKLRPNHLEKDLAKEIARIANHTRKLGYKLKKEDRDLTKKEAYRQLGHSASLLKAVLKYIDSINKKHVSSIALETIF
jgi:hypothetical protein